MKILIKNARVICPVQNIDDKRDIIVENGLIKDIVKTGTANGTFDKTIDANGLVAAPGLVDMHVHLRESGNEDEEDIEDDDDIIENDEIQGEDDLIEDADWQEQLKTLIDEIVEGGEEPEEILEFIADYLGQNEDEDDLYDIDEDDLDNDEEVLDDDEGSEVEDEDDED